MFITEIERDNIGRLADREPTGPVIYNIVTIPSAPEPDPALAADPRFKVASVSNYAWVRGNDRLVEVATAIRDRGRQDVLFVVVGQMRLTGNLPGSLGTIARRAGTLADYAAERGVGDMFRFVGHVPDPIPILAACDMLARPSRGNDPWGREILEAMALQLPVLATGTYDRFVEDGVTGILQPEFDVDATADAILSFADAPGKRDRMGEAACARVARYCEGRARAAELASLWRTVAG